MSYAMVDLYCASYPCPPRTVTLDIDDTVDIVHGHLQMWLFDTHYDERCSRRCMSMTRQLFCRW
jgi:hypothetical protein